MSQHPVQQTPQTHGDVLTAISDGMVALLKESYGHGPSRTKSYYADDLVVCVLRGGFSRVEETLLEGGRGAAASLSTAFSAEPLAWSARPIRC